MAKKTYQQVFAEIREIVGDTYDLDSAMEAIVGDCSCGPDLTRLRAEVEGLREAAIAVVVAWDDDEIGQIGGELIDTLRYAATPANGEESPNERA